MSLPIREWHKLSLRRISQSFFELLHSKPTGQIIALDRVDILNWVVGTL